MFLEYGHTDIFRKFKQSYDEQKKLTKFRKIIKYFSWKFQNIYILQSLYSKELKNNSWSKLEELFRL